MGVLQFPPAGDPFANDIPIWMTFYCSFYSTFSANRTRSHIISNNYNKISIPYTQQQKTLNSQSYEMGGSLNVRAVEKKSISGMVEAQISATAELATSFFSGGGVVRFDHFESRLKPGDRRTHNFDINMISKTAGQAEAANNIALTFQTNVFPIASNGSILTMIHPPLWCFKALVIGTNDSNIQSYWDGQPLACVLRTVDINRSPILNLPIIGSDFKPVALNIKLSFIELEPAMQKGDESLRIISRSERLAGR